MIPPEPPQPQLQPPPPPAPPNHVVTTIENLPAEGSGGGSLSASSRAGMRQRIRKVLNRDYLNAKKIRRKYQARE
ncbi:solute carrier family 35 member F1 [Cricetulus griseus]|uniref:Solute carrier family 35 member F1 n=1 Tax=Cricetulus griseus TaxID=10029 RepID=A0A061IC98_CRIGR|nr:solute carrier family 35 member F1 [Cricetulus griseus]